MPTLLMDETGNRGRVRGVRVVTVGAENAGTMTTLWLVHVDGNVTDVGRERLDVRPSDNDKYPLLWMPDQTPRPECSGQGLVSTSQAMQAGPGEVGLVSFQGTGTLTPRPAGHEVPASPHQREHGWRFPRVFDCLLFGKWAQLRLVDLRSSSLDISFVVYLLMARLAGQHRPLPYAPIVAVGEGPDETPACRNQESGGECGRGCQWLQ
jgi:hypothetical protein